MRRLNDRVIILGALGCASVIVLTMASLGLAGYRLFAKIRENQQFVESLDASDLAHDERRAEIVLSIAEKSADRLHNASYSYRPHKHEDYPTHAHVTIYTDRPPQSPLAVPRIAGYKTQWTEASWYPILFKDGRDHIYKYRMWIARQPDTPGWPSQLKVDLTEGTAHQMVEARLYPAGINAPFKGAVYYSNNWEAHGPHVQPEGGLAGKFPSAQRWTWLGLHEIRPSKHQIEGFTFQPPPVVEHYELSEGASKPASVAATWLPGRAAVGAIRCTIFYIDGSQREFNVTTGAKENGLAASWGLPADLAKQLPPTSF